jgi:RNA polymerase sigma factor for flagellar operon FliA
MVEQERTYAEAVDRDQLILGHVPLLKHIAGRMVLDTNGAVDRDDLYGWGMIGLIQAADSWEPARGLKFSTYAFPKIRGAILDELRRLDFLPRSRRERVRDLDHVVNELRHDRGKVPSPQEIATRMGIGLNEVDEILLSARSAVQTSLDGEPPSKLRELLIDPTCSDPHGSAEWGEARELLMREIARLAPQEKSVITLYYAEGLLLRDIGRVLGVSESRVSQIHTRALFQLNRALAPSLGVSP